MDSQGSGRQEFLLDHWLMPKLVRINVTGTLNWHDMALNFHLSSHPKQWKRQWKSLFHYIPVGDFSKNRPAKNESTQRMWSPRKPKPSLKKTPCYVDGKQRISKWKAHCIVLPLYLHVVRNFLLAPQLHSPDSLDPEKKQL